MEEEEQEATHGINLFPSCRDVLCTPYGRRERERERERWAGMGCVFAQTDMFKHFCLSLVRQTQSSSPLPLERSMSAHFLHLSTKMDEKKEEGNRSRERERERRR